MTAEIRFERGSTNRLTTLNPVLGQGEPCLDFDTGTFKVGDGHTPWIDLPAFLTEPYITGIVEVIIAESGGLSGDPRVGDLAELTTDVKDLIVNAINEVNMINVEFDLLYDNAKAG